VTDPDTLETGILIAACGLPVELDELADRGADDTLRRALGACDERVKEWSQGRVEYLAVAACLLSGLPTDGLPIENPQSVRASVQRELPRYLMFLARRANERTPGAPDVTVAAADLATALEYGVAERGSGGLLDALKRGLPADGTRARRAAERYAGLRAAGVGSLKDALPYLDGAGRAFAAARPRGAPRLDVADDRLVARIDYRGRPVRVHARVVREGGAVYSSLESADPREIPLALLRQLGESGQRRVVVEVVVGGSMSLNAWAYARRATTVTIPAPAVDYAALEHVLRADDLPDADGVGEDGVPEPELRSEHRMARGEFQRLVTGAPPAIKRAAGLIARQAPTQAGRIEAVGQLLRRRALGPGAGPARPLHDITTVDALTSREAAELAAALLWRLEIPARTLPAMLDNVLATVPALLHEGRWYWLPIWPDTPFEVYHQKIDRWPAQKADDGKPGVGWEAVSRYREIDRRALPLAAAALAPPPTATTDDKDAAGPSCPICKGLMRKRSSQRGEFWGCTRYPECRGTRPV